MNISKHANLKATHSTKTEPTKTPTHTQTTKIITTTIKAAQETTTKTPTKHIRNIGMSTNQGEENAWRISSSTKKKQESSMNNQITKEKLSFRSSCVCSASRYFFPFLQCSFWCLEDDPWNKDISEISTGTFSLWMKMGRLSDRLTQSTYHHNNPITATKISMAEATTLMCTTQPMANQPTATETTDNYAS